MQFASTPTLIPFLYSVGHGGVGVAWSMSFETSGEVLSEGSPQPVDYRNSVRGGDTSHPLGYPLIQYG